VLNIVKNAPDERIGALMILLSEIGGCIDRYGRIVPVCYVLQYPQCLRVVLIDNGIKNIAYDKGWNAVGTPLQSFKGLYNRFRRTVVLFDAFIKGLYGRTEVVFAVLFSHCAIA